MLHIFGDKNKITWSEYKKALTWFEAKVKWSKSLKLNLSINWKFASDVQRSFTPLP
jgi:hypothetical protein